MIDSIAHDLKSRLEWGQPGFTILDVRDRHSYNKGHITGAVSLPIKDLAERAKSSFHTKRDIFVYGENDTETAQAVNTLREAGFSHVTELKGGLAAWKSVGGATEEI
ncbi:rhodanese-like domain-containing protein [Chlorogloeopsis fritschii PCC 9212]|jgi:rhodanese-related sulfurtransferase|uniref:Rhodanese n=1 Tax=Chlorogloeopsis fritschii PCC 6912 TaxID=211165 RepID=A0A3S0ZS65_CHLFR|nr:rhodanese-like domain-containing protein [Chlorogloeopsis fritschii]RUR76254.1 rhodanese [Chlorogloeopsis fritschii PCC 6912]